MKKLILGIFIFSLLIVISCNITQDIKEQGSNTGRLVVKFDLSGDTKVINYDFSQVNSGKVFLQQGGSVKYQANLIIDIANKTGEAAISNVVIGSYDVIIELYDSASNVIYSGTSTVTVYSDINSTVIMQLSKDIGTLTVTGSWIEDIPGLASAIVQLRKNSVVSYASNLILDTNNKTVTGGISNIQPDSYDIYVEIKNTTGMVCFTGTQTIIITKKNNSVTLTLVVKTGSIIISVTGDATAPVITTSPTTTINGQDVTITWTTNENATSNVCYSTSSGFNYQIATDWVPVGQDLTADNTNHSVVIQGLVQDQTYYYVVVSADAEGNMVVSDEMNFVVNESTTPTLPSLAGTYDTPGNANDIEVSGNYAYIADGGTIQIVDISNPISPSSAGSCALINNGSHLAVSGNYCYVSLGGYPSPQLEIFDISNPAIPASVGVCTGSWGGTDVVISGGYAYWGQSEDGLKIVNITTPNSPSLAGSYDWYPNNVFGVVVLENLAYISAGSCCGSPYGNVLTILNISNPASPQLVGTFNPGIEMAGYAITVSGNYAFIADYYSGLMIINISNPISPTLVTTYNTPGSATGVAVSGNYAFVADWSNGLVIIDISNPSSPALAGHYDTPGTAAQVKISGKYAYVADSDSGLQIIQVFP